VVHSDCGHSSLLPNLGKTFDRYSSPSLPLDLFVEVAIPLPFLYVVVGSDMDCSCPYVEVGSGKSCSCPYVEVVSDMGIPSVVEAKSACPLDYPTQEQERVGTHTLIQGSEVAVESSRTHMDSGLERIKPDQEV
jgi:hypothetical protein